MHVAGEQVWGRPGDQLVPCDTFLSNTAQRTNYLHHLLTEASVWPRHSGLSPAPLSFMCNSTVVNVYNHMFN
jgi:hypothetical protein